MKLAIVSPVSVVGLGLGSLIALASAACVGSNQPPPATASEPSTEITPGDPRPATVVDATGTVWGTPAQPPSDPTPSGMPSSSNQPATTDSVALSAGPPTDGELSKLDDGELAALVGAVDEGEIRLAQLAEAQAANLEVKRFAHDMLVAHQSMESQDKAFLSGVNIAPTGSAISKRLESATQSEVTELTNLHGEAFDHAYVDRQVRDHTQAIDLFDRIIPNVRSASFKAHLAEERPKLQAHLRMATSVQTSVEKGLTNRQANPEKH
jgi:putative membrane protein